MNKPKTIILSLGGSLIVPDIIDASYLSDFKKLIYSLVPQYRFIIFTGGGKIARSYQQAATELDKTLPASAKDWIGIKASLLNAELVKFLLSPQTHDQVITDPRVKVRWSKSIWIGAGWKPGRSTDYDAVRIAAENNISTVINLSDIDYVYTKDPKKHKDAKIVTQFSWKDFRKLVGNHWDPGLNVPFDPVAARLAQQKGITVKILNGRKLSNVKRAIQDTSFIGTTIA